MRVLRMIGITLLCLVGTAETRWNADLYILTPATLNSLTDVDTTQTTLTAGDVLRWDHTNKVWKQAKADSSFDSLTLNGNVIQKASTYYNYGTTAGASGYGFYDNAGTMQYKNTGGAWADIASEATSAGGWTDDGTTVRLTTATDTVKMGAVVGLAKYPVSAKDTGATLTTADFGKSITVLSATAQTINLPSVDATNIGGWFTIVKLGAGTVTIDAPDSDLIADSSAGGTIYDNMVGETYATITLQLVSATRWVIVSAHGTWTTT